MTLSEKARVQECVQELSEILYRNTPSNNRSSPRQTLEDIEKQLENTFWNQLDLKWHFFYRTKNSNKSRKRTNN